MLSERPWKLELVVRFGLWLLILNFAVGMVITAWLSSKYVPLDLRPESVTILAGTICFHGVAFVLTCWLVRAHQLTFASAFGLTWSRLWWPLTLGILSGLLAVPLLGGLGDLWVQLLRLFHL